MGNVCAQEGVDKEAQSVSRKIDQALMKDGKEYAEEIKILLLGTGESGKTTIAKQMKIIHLAGYSAEEKAAYKPLVYINVITAAQILITQARKRELKFQDEQSAEFIENIQVNGPNINYTEEMAQCVSTVWNEPCIKEVFALSSEYQIPDSASFFLDNCMRFCKPNYIPDDFDILRVRAKTTGIIETSFMIRKKKFRLVDVGGQRNERKKWIHCFQDVTGIIFCVAMSEYDQVLIEDSLVNRMHESLKLFADIINNMWFENTAIILFLNKKDLFQEKIKRVDMTCCFPLYNGGLDYDAGSNYIKKKFMEKNKSNKRAIYPHFTNATDTSNIKTVFDDVQGIILRKVMDEIGFDI